MSSRPPLDPMTSMWHWLAYDLRFYRERAGLTGTELGKIIGVVRSTVSRLEAADLKLDDRQTMALDRHWKTGGHFFRLLTYAKLGHDPDWFKEHVDRESKASVIKIFEHSVIPGLLQTEAYARVIFRVGGVKDIDADVATRMARQEALFRPDPPLVWVLLNQAAIELPVGGAAVMREQLARLLEVSELPDVMLRVVPRAVGWHSGMDGAFKLLTVGREESAYTQACGGGRLVLDAEEVRAYGLRYDRIGSEALSRDSSRSLIKEVMESMQ